MRVLVVTDWPRLEGGTERYVALLVEAMRAQGDDVRLMTTSAGSAAGGTADYVAYGTDSRAAQAGLQIANPSAVLTLRRALREFRPDAVHLNMFLQHTSPAILPLLRDVPTLLMVSDLKPVCPNSTKLRPDGSQCRARAGSVCWHGGCLSLPRYIRDYPRYRMFRDSLCHINRLCTISTAMQTELSQAGMHAELVPLPVVAPTPAFRHRPAAEPTFVYGGRLAPVKGVDALVRAFARVRAVRPDTRLRISGDGPDRDAIVSLIATLGLGDAVETSFVMREDWTEELSDAWAVVTPSVFREPLGLVAVEAIVRGVPVIATAGGGLGDTVEHGVSGLLVPNGDEDALANAMLDVAEGRALASHAVPDQVVAAIRRRHDPASHVRTVREMFARMVPAVAA